ncbi:MAG: sodium-dependent bicarbonate transport family permease [Alphaproteobacteria bacterium]|nr:sodium-dependent bicarbonate transport family permease [Alphaproteobacteria bacterium]
MVLAFALGAVAAWLRSDLRLPEAFQAGLTVYLLLAIGLKGGVALGAAPVGAILPAIAAGVGICMAIPLWCYPALRRLGGFARADAAALAAHYGSVSAVTFLAGLAYLERARVPVEGFMPALLAIMEAPAIIVALLLVRQREAASAHEGLGAALREVLVGKSIVLLLGGLVVGALAGEAGYASVKPFFGDVFPGMLTLFLLDMGVTAARRWRESAGVGRFLIAFALAAPPLNGMLGAAAGAAAGLSVGGTAMLAILAASASYIAAPAAARLALPEANPGYYLAAALGITFPFNLVVGLPLYHGFAAALAGGR